MNAVVLDQFANADAPLPSIYQQAVHAIAECDRIDECKDWVDKAKALASYAKQAGDPRLFNYATRIKARAVERSGVLLKEYDGRGDHWAENKKEGDRLSILSPTQAQAGAEAGMSSHQVKQAIRVANVPKEEFEQLVEGDNPPTISRLAELGTRARPAPERPPEFPIATQVVGAARRFAEQCAAHDPQTVMRGLVKTERSDVAELMEAICKWTAEFGRVE